MEEDRPSRQLDFARRGPRSQSLEPPGRGEIADRLLQSTLPVRLFGLKIQRTRLRKVNHRALIPRQQKFAAVIAHRDMHAVDAQFEALVEKWSFARVQDVPRISE